MGGGGGGGGSQIHVCPYSEFQMQSFRLLKRRPCCCRYCTTVFVIFPVAGMVSTHLHVICQHFISPMSFFKAMSIVGILP